MLSHISKLPSFFKAELCPIVCTQHSFLVHSSADGHVGCFHILATVNSVTNDEHGNAHISLRS